MCSVSFKSEGQKQEKVQERICKTGILSKFIKLWLQDKRHQILSHHAMSSEKRLIGNVFHFSAWKQSQTHYQCS